MLNNKNFDLANEPDGAALFVLSAWHELFHGFTPDSYQPRLHNVPSLVEELVSISELWAHSPHLKVHSQQIQKELENAIGNESDLLAKLPRYRTQCQSLVKSSTPNECICGGTILIGMADKYWSCFVEHAKDSISGLPASKTDALKNIRRLATFAFQNGKEDDDVWLPFQDCERQSASSLFDRMIKMTNERDKSYMVTLAVIGDPSVTQSISRSRGFIAVSPRSLSHTYLNKVDSPNEKTLYIQQRKKSVSIRRAVSEARKDVEFVIGLVSLYQNPDAGIRIHSAALVSLNASDRTIVQSEQAFRRLLPRRDASQQIKDVSQRLSSGSVDTRLMATIEQLALAAASSDSRTRFINLWAALETLAGAYEGANTMSKVCGVLVPLIVSRHVHRTTRYLTILLNKYKDANKITSLGPGFSKRRGRLRKIQQDELLITLASREKSAAISGLLAAVKQPLLRWKVNECWNVFNNPKSLLKRLKQSQQSLEWHLSRIYRARNMLVHEGVETPHTTPLLDNLQHYLSTLVQRLIHELETEPDWSIRQVVEYWNARKNHLFVELQEGDGSSMLTDDFLEQIKHPKPVWPCNKES